MSEELENLELEQESGEEENESTVSPAEEKAMASGWRPEDEWDGDSDEWIDAKTFNRNGEFMTRIQKQSKELSSNRDQMDKLKDAMKELGDHNKKIAEQEFKKAMTALKKEKLMALEEDDHRSAEEIADKIDELKEAKQEAKEAEVVLEKPPADVAPDPEFMAWAGDNSWYSKDVILRGAADALGMEYADKHPGAPLADVLEHVTKHIKDEFPSKFGNKNQGNPGAVTEKSSNGRKPKKSKYSEKDLSDEQKQFAKMFVETGAFDNIQEYVDQLVVSGEL